MKYPGDLFLEVEFWKSKGHMSRFINDNLSTHCSPDGFVVMVVFDELL
jgi:hypothetical protein